MASGWLLGSPDSARAPHREAIRRGDTIWRYPVSMATDTATIRVTRRTRDLLARQAQARGVSLAAMLEQLARDAARDAMLDSEREAARTDALNGLAVEEQSAWETTLADGID